MVGVTGIEPATASMSTSGSALRLLEQESGERLEVCIFTTNRCINAVAESTGLSTSRFPPCGPLASCMTSSYPRSRSACAAGWLCAICRSSPSHLYFTGDGLDPVTQPNMCRVVIAALMPDNIDRDRIGFEWQRRNIEIAERPQFHQIHLGGENL